MVFLSAVLHSVHCFISIFIYEMPSLCSKAAGKIWSVTSVLSVGFLCSLQDERRGSQTCISDPVSCDSCVSIVPYVCRLTVRLGKAKIGKFHGCLLGFGLCPTALQGGKDADRALNGHIRCTTS